MIDRLHVGLLFYILQLILFVRLESSTRSHRIILILTVSVPLFTTSIVDPVVECIDFSGLLSLDHLDRMFEFLSRLVHIMFSLHHSSTDQSLPLIFVFLKRII